MKKKVKTKILALCGKAGAGKDTLLNMLEKAHPEYHKIVSCTTRPPREGEIEGRDYFFLTNEQFINKIASGDMLETAIFNDWCYGTAKSQLTNDALNIGIFNPEGIESLKSDNSVEVLAILVFAHDKTRLLRQLNREEKPDVHEIVRRFTTDEQDFEGFSPDFIAYNDGPTLEQLCAEIAREAADWMRK